MALQEASELEWDYDVALLTNRHMLAAITKAMLGGAIGCALLVAFPLAVQGDWEEIPPIFALFGMIWAGIFALTMLIMALMFRNKIKTRFRIDADGVELRLVDRTALASNRAAFWLGLVLGKPGAAGTGALAMTQEQQRLAWSGAFTAHYEPATRSIAFRNGWRTLLRVYCPLDLYDRVCAMVAAGMAGRATAARVSAHSPLRGYLLRTLLVIVCSVPLLAMAEEFDLSGFTPFLMLCFALATVWLIRPLALVVLAALAWMALELAVSLTERRESMFGGAPYLRYEVLGGDDWVMLALCAACAGVLGWLAVQTWRGRIVPALTQDWADAGDD